MGCSTLLVLLLGQQALLTEPTRLLGHDASVYCVLFSADGKIVYSGGGDGTVRLWDTQTGQQEGVIDAGRRAVYSMSFDPKRERLYVGDRGGELAIIDVQRNEIVEVLKAHDGFIVAAEVRADGNQLLTAASDDTMKFWDLTVSPPIVSFTVEYPSPVRSAAYAPDGRLAASGHADGIVKIWVTATGQEKTTLRAHTTKVNGIAFSADGSMMATCDEDGRCIVWRLDGRGQPLVLDGGAPLQAVAFSPRGGAVAAGGKNDNVRVWDTSTGKVVAELYDQQRQADQGLRGMKFAPVGLMLAVPHLDRVVRLWRGNVPTWADTPGETAKRLIAALGTGTSIGARALSFGYDARDWAPWEIANLKPGRYEVGETLVQHKRAVVALDKKTYLWLEQRDGVWGCVGYRASRALSRDWLYQDGKRGTAELPENAVDAFIEAVSDGDARKAEALCSRDGWIEGKWAFGTIFENTRKSKAKLKRIGFEQTNRRAYALLRIVHRAKARGEFYVLCMQRGGWMLAAVTPKQEVAEEFLTGKPWPFRPADPEKLVAVFAQSCADRADWQLERTCTGAYLAHEKGALVLYRRAPRAELKAAGKPKIAEDKRRAVATVKQAQRTLHLLAMRGLRGWRIDGHTEDAELAKAYLAGTAHPPR
ncbi:MAG: WD40 repeat domain-containing protein [Planctomycetota bacterium]|jgi:hypothetical protein